ncbi:unnamed protein product [Bursaphelenchus xylophilus]|uniref:(pine wood nematode) hypothetical protein n=1 Tax=Bursaphelenchus xylophilus TaxID=6326 RepID=A0A1I7RP31_BURXY|nr:unnamed protein product [Bursaphelenchus xylophilus]CAG9124496.1 unnamed protein product [Bursaphelenchus xylophilus]
MHFGDWDLRPLVLLGLLGLLFVGQTSAEGHPESCSAEQILTSPCRCCKMDCWYTIAKTATHELGHVPGQAGENEALATLKLIRACMMEECAELCPQRTPFRPNRLLAQAAEE